MEKLKKLREIMQRKNISALIVPSTDPHGSEYVAEYWQARQMISGFTGSAGTAVITLNSAALWTDSRYFLQAEEQLNSGVIPAQAGISCKNCHFILMKDGLPDTPTISAWLGSQLSANETVSIDAELFSVNEVQKLENQLNKFSIKLLTSENLISEIWENRQPLPCGEIILFEKNAGVTVQQKLENLREKMQEENIDTFVFTALDEIAWLFNIRGCDVEYNPVAISYAVVSLCHCGIDQQSPEKNVQAFLFIDNQKLNSQSIEFFAKNNIEILPYENIIDFIKKIENQTVGIDFNKANYAIFQAINENCKIKDFVSPIILAKSLKNKTELAGFRRAMKKDGVALVKFFQWLENELPKGYVTELYASEMLHAFRAEQKDFVCESFETIAAYGAHGAIVHYEPTRESDILLKPEGLFLLDSGGQYLDGTTDITRTVALGRLSKQEKIDFTLVLKGHIALAQARFPENTRGTQLDILARQYLWQHCANFGHGTGHGVGHFLCVHEGPQSVRMNENPTTLQAGMVLSNEPGLYRAGKWGIRCENLLAVNELRNTDFGNFLSFETLSLFPFDTRAIERSLLTENEISWLNTYHSKAYKTLSPLLSKSEKIWLRKKCKTIF
ncbi:MAG: aminopeptidase P family protein [Prevotellaceae bacterium]|jgi:Xaa-Pro aminopeptidase|nr:aminopeptidase P family protein [Prevotellaceae bacterium]